MSTAPPTATDRSIESNKAVVERLLTFWYAQFERLASTDLAPRPGVRFADDLAPSPLETTPEGTPIMPEKKPSNWIHKLEVTAALGDQPARYRATFCQPTRKEPMPSATAHVEFWMLPMAKYPLPPLPVPLHAGPGPAPKVLDRRVVLGAQFENSHHSHVWVVDTSTGEWYAYDWTRDPLPVTAAGQEMFRRQRRFNPFQLLSHCLNMKKQLETPVAADGFNAQAAADNTGLAFSRYFCDVFPPDRPAATAASAV